MKIRVFDFYQNIYGVKIQAGIYEHDAPEMQGMTDELLASGQAVVIDSEPFGQQNPDDLDVQAQLLEPDIPEFSKAALELMEANQLTADDFAGFGAKVTVNDVRDKISGGS